MTLLFVRADAAAAAADAADWVRRRAHDDLAKRGRFSIALSGGSTPKLLYDALIAKSEPPVAWGDVEVFFSDERCVPPTHDDSNYRLAKDALLDPVRARPHRVHRLRGEAADPDAEALRAEAELLAVVEDGAIDLVLLGLGPDGHVASLFPGSPALDETERLVVAARPARAPAVRRLTFTLPLINRAREVVILAVGAEKADAVARVIEAKDPALPATRVAPASRRLVWFVDEGAASKVSSRLRA